MYSLEQFQALLDLATKQIPSIYTPLIAELAYLAAKQINADPTDFIAHLSTVARLQIGSKNCEPRLGFQAILHEHPYDYFALHGLIYILETEDANSSELQLRLALLQGNP